MTSVQEIEALLEESKLNMQRHMNEYEQMQKKTEQLVQQLDSLKSNKDSFLHSDNIDKRRQDELRSFLTGLQNDNPNAMIERFSAYILSQKQLIKELHSIIASKAEPEPSRFGGSSSKLVYSLKKRKSNKGNKTKRHKGNKSK